MRIALTGFEPFDELPFNPTADLALQVAEPTGVRFVRSVWPVEFEACADAYRAWLDEVRPDAILNLGLFARSGWVQPERVALRYGLDRKQTGAALEQSGPVALETRMDTRALSADLRERGVPCGESFHAGVYLCNWMYYASLDWADGRALFLHLPFDTERAAGMSERPDRRFPSLPMATLERAVQRAAAAL